MSQINRMTAKENWNDLPTTWAICDPKEKSNVLFLGSQRTKNYILVHCVTSSGPHLPKNLQIEDVARKHQAIAPQGLKVCKYL